MRGRVVGGEERGRGQGRSCRALWAAVRTQAFTPREVGPGGLGVESHLKSVEHEPKGGTIVLRGPEVGAGVQVRDDCNLDGGGWVSEKWVRCSVGIF